MYLTNFHTYCTSTLEGHQRAHIREACRLAGVEWKDGGWAVQCGMNGWKCRRGLPDGEIWGRMVREGREWLGLGELDGSSSSTSSSSAISVSDAWKKNNINKIVQYNFRVLQLLDHNPDARKFSLAPICNIKRHFVTIDTTVMLRAILPRGWLRQRRMGRGGDGKEGEGKGMLPGKGGAERAAVWGAAFEMGKMAALKGGVGFADFVQSDGVSLCVHFREVETGAATAAAGAAATAAAGTAAGTAAGAVVVAAATAAAATTARMAMASMGMKENGQDKRPALLAG